MVEQLHSCTFFYWGALCPRHNNLYVLNYSRCRIPPGDFQWPGLKRPWGWSLDPHPRFWPSLPTPPCQLSFCPGYLWSWEPLEYISVEGHLKGNCTYSAIGNLSPNLSWDFGWCTCLEVIHTPVSKPSLILVKPDKLIVSASQNWAESLLWSVNWSSIRGEYMFIHVSPGKFNITPPSNTNAYSWSKSPWTWLPTQAPCCSDSHYL